MDYEEMSRQAKICMDYKREKMEKFKPITQSINTNFDNKEYEFIFTYTESKSDTIHVCGLSSDEFAINAAVGMLLEHIRMSRLNATAVFKTLFDQCNADEINSILNSIFGKQS